MGIYLNPGNESFKKALRSQIYVDKTELISYTNRVLGTEQSYICVSRPRRFGKSMAANMLAAYYSKGCRSKEIFENLQISKKDNFSSCLNQYNVIFLNIQHFLREVDKLENLTHYIEECVLKELKKEYTDILLADENSLAKTLEIIYNTNPNEKGFVFIIDEWDCIFREAKENTVAQKNYLDFLRHLLKDRSYVQLAYMTGILPIKKYGTQSALNMFSEFTMTKPGKLAKYIGFTEEEVKSLCLKYNMDFSEAKQWYDGYKFKKIQHIYNPKSIVEAMLEEEYQSFWTSTETYELLQVYIDLDIDSLKESIISMLSGDKVVIDAGSFQNDMTSFKSKDDVLSLLVHLGYLAYDEEEKSVFIPNKEVRQEFLRAIKNGTRTKVVEIIQKSDKVVKATFEKDTDNLACCIDEFHSLYTSPDYYNNEESLRSVIKIAFLSIRDEYSEIYELPTGKGYADVVYLPNKTTSKPALIIELKWNKTPKAAISQIKEKCYPERLKSYTGSILLVGINYDEKTKKHQCIIEEYHM